MPYAGLWGAGKGDVPIFASARDYGNMAAGYIARVNGRSWGKARLGFDALESGQDFWPAVEGMPTQMAQRVGYDLGKAIYLNQYKAK